MNRRLKLVYCLALNYHPRCFGLWLEYVIRIDGLINLGWSTEEAKKQALKELIGELNETQV